MWWQFARAVCGEVQYRQCKNKSCGKPIEIGKDTSKRFIKTREFCSPACKQQDQRARVKLAKELKSHGKSVNQIAKQLDTKPKVITNWLTKKK